MADSIPNEQPREAALKATIDTDAIVAQATAQTTGIPPIDQAGVRHALWRLLESSISAGAEALMSELGEMSRRMPGLSDIALIQRRVGEVMSQLTPRLESSYYRLLSDIDRYVFPLTSSTSPSPSSSSTTTPLPSVTATPNAEISVASSKKDEEIQQLLKRLRAADEKIAHLTALKQTTDAHNAALAPLCDSLDNIINGDDDENGPNLKESLAQLESTVSAATHHHKECVHLLKEVYPNASLVPVAAQPTDPSEQQEQLIQDTEYVTADEVFGPGVQTSDRSLDKEVLAFCDMLKGTSNSQM